MTRTEREMAAWILAKVDGIAGEPPVRITRFSGAREFDTGDAGFEIAFQHGRKHFKGGRLLVLVREVSDEAT